jgi:hypothetical protein
MRQCSSSSSSVPPPLPHANLCIGGKSSNGRKRPRCKGSLTPSSCSKASISSRHPVSTGETKTTTTTTRIYLKKRKRKNFQISSISSSQKSWTHNIIIISIHIQETHALDGWSVFLFSGWSNRETLPSSDWEYYKSGWMCTYAHTDREERIGDDRSGESCDK